MIEFKDGDKMYFEARGCTITDKDYRGDIFNHRISTEFVHNGVTFYIGVTSCSTDRKKRHKEDNNGIYIVILAEEKEVVRSCGGKFFLYNKPTQIAEGLFYQDLPEALHTKKQLKWFVEMELRLCIDEIIITGEEK